MNTSPFPSLVMIVLGLAMPEQTTAADTGAQSPLSPEVTRVVDRGQDFAIFDCITPIVTANGEARFATNRFTLLENGLHYLDEGVWKESVDVIEAFPAGAVARYGPIKAIFSSDLNAETVFDIELSDGKRLRGGVRAIQLTNMRTGQTIVVARVKDTALGELLPPNQLVWRDAFDGLAADVVIVWRHNSFSHDVVIRERPELPRGWDPAAVRLEVLTEIVEAPAPETRRQLVGRDGEEKLEDHVVIDFGGLVMLMGHGFPVQGERAWALGSPADAPGAVPILKQFHELPDGRRFLIESIAWKDAEPALNGQSVAARAQASTTADSIDDPRASNSTRDASTPPRQATADVESGNELAHSQAAARTWPGPRAWRTERQPIALAQAPYEVSGYVVDFWIIPDQGTPTTLQTGQTYYVRTSYYSGNSVTFQAGCTIKFKNNAYMLLYGPVSFPASTPYAVFTSRNDDLFGQRIQGVTGEPDSDADPTSHRASQAVWIYYVDFATTIRNVQIRWAAQGVRYDMNPDTGVTHNLQNSLLQNCATGVYLNPDSSVSLSGIQKCDVSSDYSGGGSVSGSMTTWSGCDTLVNSPTKDLTNPDPQQNTQNETAVTVAGGKIIAAWMDTNKGHESLGQAQCCHTDYFGFHPTEYCNALPQFLAWAVSSDGGQTFVDKGEPPLFQYTRVGGGTGYLGDAGDPMLASYGNTVYLAGNPQRPGTYQPQGSQDYKLYLPLWKSTDQGLTFGSPDNIAALSTPIPGAPDAPALIPGDPAGDFLDKPWLAVGPSNGNLYMAVTWQKKGAGAETTILFFLYFNDQGTWRWQHQRFREADKVMQAPYVVTGGGAIYLFWRTTGSTDPVRLRKSTDQGTTFMSPTQNGQIPDSAAPFDGNLLRNSHTNVPDQFANDRFRAPAIFQASVNPQYNHVYLVYHDLDPNDPHGMDILFHYSTDGGVNWTGPVRVNDDDPARDQWQPCIAVRPNGTKLFVGWYDRHHDSWNHRIRVRGMIATVAAQNPLSARTYLDISAEDFAPVFTSSKDDGTQASEGFFDPVYGRSKVTEGTDEHGHPLTNVERCGRFENHMGDYDQVVADPSYIYYCWGDNRVRRSGRVQADIRLRRIAW